MKPYYILIQVMIAIGICGDGYAQSRDDYWFFGDSAGIHFLNDSVETISNSVIHTHEACASISDNSGSLLFYSDGTTVWNRTHLVMENGEGLLIGSVFQNLGSSSTNGVTIINSPNSDSLYYIITVGSFDTIGLRYSEIDISQNGGLGAITNNKNILLVQDTLCEKVSAVKHGNGRDWWVICRSLKAGYNRFYTALLTPQGWEGPYFQDIGTANTSWLNYFYIGEATFAPMGNRYVCVSVGGQIDLFDFDRCTGELSNFIPIGVDSFGIYNYYGASFSANGSKLYVSNVDTLFQYDLTSTNVKNSKSIIWIEPDPEFNIYQHQIGSDNKLYISSGYYSFPNDTFDLKNQNLSVINFPDSSIGLLNLTPYSVSLGTKRSNVGLPNNPNYALGPLVGSACDTLGLSNGKPLVPSLKIIPNPSSGKFRIEIPEAAVCERIRVIDVAGRKVSDKAPPGVMKEIEIDLGHLADGTYYVEIECLDGKVLRSKFMIQR